MEALIKLLDDLVNSYGVSGTWISACLGVAGLGVLVFYMIKSIILLQSHLKPDGDNPSKEDLSWVKAVLQEDHKHILKLLESIDERLKRDVYERLVDIDTSNEHLIEVSRRLEAEMEKVNAIAKHIKDMQEDDVRMSTSVLHDVDALVADTKSQGQELSRHVQALQVDLAALHGTLIGLNTQRSRLK